MPNNVYTPDDRGLGYESNRLDRMNGPVQVGGYGYELPQAQTWNPNAFNTNNNFQPFAATGRMKSQTRGRSTLPSVCTPLPHFCRISITNTTLLRHGWTSSKCPHRTPTVALDRRL